jgi:hypothetical protein
MPETEFQVFLTQEDREMRLIGNRLKKPLDRLLVLACAAVMGVAFSESADASSLPVEAFQTGFANGSTPDGCVIPNGGYATGQNCTYARLTFVKANVTVADPTKDFSWAYSVDPANFITPGVCNGVCWEIGANYVAATRKGNIYVAFPNALGEGYLDWGFNYEDPWAKLKGFGSLCLGGACALPTQTSLSYSGYHWTAVFGEPSIVPLPATLPFLITALGALMIAVRRRTIHGPDGFDAQMQ